MSLGASLCNGYDGRIAIDGGAGREDDVLASMITHDVQEDEGASHIVVIILQGLRNTFAHGLESSKVNDSIRLFGLENLCQGFCITDVGLVERNLLPDDFPHALQSLRVGIVKIVNNDNTVTSLVKLDNGVTADIAGTTCKKNLHIC